MTTTNDIHLTYADGWSELSATIPFVTVQLKTNGPFLVVVQPASPGPEEYKGVLLVANSDRTFSAPSLVDGDRVFGRVLREGDVEVVTVVAS